MHGQAYLRKGLIAHLGTTLEEYLWLAAQVPADLLDTVPARAPRSVRTELIDLAVELDTVVYPALIALLEDGTAPVLPADLIAARRASWTAADLMVAMKQIRYRFQATAALLADTPDAVWGHPTGAPTPLAGAVFGLWRQLLAHLDTLAATVAALHAIPPAGPPAVL